jgi:glycine cleavage system aminomethyltransferase T
MDMGGIDSIDQQSSQKVEKAFVHHPLIPYDPRVWLYIAQGSVVLPFEWTNWRDETMAGKHSCSIHASLNPQPTFRVKGPEALKFLSDVCVNDFTNFPIGRAKHAIMCNQEGLDMGDGVLMRLGEDEFLTYEMGANHIAYVFRQGNYDAVGEDLTGTNFLYQIVGPQSLEVLEAVTGDDLHDIGFAHFRRSSVDGMEVTVLRVGMPGTLAYELHGKVEEGPAVYNAVLRAGEPLGMRRLGFRAYLMQHTEGGFPQAFNHFPHPWLEDEGFLKYLEKIGIRSRYTDVCKGSMGPDLRLRYRNPVELGWGRMISFNHDFVGRKALEKEVANPRRKMVTLVWNTEDVLDVRASEFRPGEPYASMESPYERFVEGAGWAYYADQVLMDGSLVGISSGRTQSYNFRQMLSLCSIDVEYGELGTEVTVLWGDPGTRQKEIRAIVSRFPYLCENRNEDVDVKTIPRLRAQK